MVTLDEIFPKNRLFIGTSIGQEKDLVKEKNGPAPLHFLLIIKGFIGVLTGS